MRRALPSRLISGALVLILAAAFTGVAMAASPYTVTVTVKPTSLKLGKAFTITAKGRSANTSLLWVYVNIHRKCSLTKKADGSIASNNLVMKFDVTNAYTHSYSHVSLNKGTHYACAYLTALLPSSAGRGHASARYKVS